MAVYSTHTHISTTFMHENQLVYSTTRWEQPDVYSIGRPQKARPTMQVTRSTQHSTLLIKDNGGRSTFFAPLLNSSRR